MTVLRVYRTEEDLEVPQWVKFYDADAMDGWGLVELTHDKAEALVFSDPKEALKFWRQQSTVKPLRDDGKPNRPLTAYTVEMERT